MKKNLINIETLLTALIVTFVIISSSSMSVKIINTENFNIKINEAEQTISKLSTGLAPRAIAKKQVFKTADENNNLLESKVTSDKGLSNARIMYGYNANCPSIEEGPISFDINDPGTVTLLQATQSNDFLSGGTWNADEQWICCENGSGVLWEVDPDDGTMISIGGGGVSLNGLAWDPINNQMYGASDSGLYMVDYETGYTDLIGNFGDGPINMIGVACDTNGEMYGWDIGTDNLWDISLDTGQAYLVGPLGIDINYAQDGCNDWYYNTLYLTAYTTKGQLYECDKETGECTLIGDFQDGAQITASMILNFCPPDHDIGVKGINYPQNGYASPEVPIQVTVKNYGSNPEISDVKITVNNSYDKYNETIENVEVNPGGEIIVDFPTWTPTYWQDPDYENTWQEYQVKACTLLDDDYPSNDCKEKIIELYFPWMHDIEIRSIDSPCKDGPGKTYPVKATIKNVGQYPECCIPINISIGEPVVLDTLLIEESWETVPPSGWTDEHKNYSSDYGWNKSYTSYSGGSSPEARLPYNYALPDKVFYSYAFNTSDYSACRLKFLSHINHYSGQGLYTLEVGYSYDGETWYSAWSIAPGSSGSYNVSVKFESGYETTFIGFWVKGNPWYMNNWYIDNVEVKAVDLVSEYTDSMCQGSDIEPGESVTFEFDDWIPDFLQYETTGLKDYIVHAEINMEGDNNPDNDIVSELFTLDYWHDSKIEVANPYPGRESEEWLGFDDGTAVNSLGLTAGGTFEYAIRLTPDELGDYGGYVISSVKRHHDYQTPFTMSGKVKIYEQGTPTSPGDLRTEQPFTCYEANWHKIMLDDPVDITGYEDIWVSIEVTHASGQQPAAMDAANNYPGKGDWIYLSSWVEVSIYGFYTDWLIRAGVEQGSCFPKKVWIQPGAQEIEGLASNQGTFPELDLICYAEIYDYIDDPENGTLLYEDNITNIDLDEPLGGIQPLIFDDFNFAREGIYVLLLDMPDGDDDYQRNNKDKLIILVDDTEPVSTHALEPANPDGDNGWYVSDVEVTLDADDPWIIGVSSGVKQIKYKIDGGTTQTINGDHGTFVIDTDKDNLPIEYWAIDWVGNEESHNTFTIDMDQTDPSIDLIYTCEDGPNGPGKAPWRMIFTAYATDETSKMDRVEFYLNDVLQDTVTGPGPTYIWQFLYSGGLYIIIDSIAYDKAGNMKFDEIIEPENINFNLQQYQSGKNLQIMQKTSYKILS